MALYLVKDGIYKNGYIVKDGQQKLDTDFHLITFDFKTNEGYVDKKGLNKWRLYTQVGQKLGKSRYYTFSNFSKCVEKLKQLNGNCEVVICNCSDILSFTPKAI